LFLWIYEPVASPKFVQAFYLLVFWWKISWTVIMFNWQKYTSINICTLMH
jgi:hypothetical protein